MNTLDKYLEKHNLKRAQLARNTGISTSTWQSVSERPLDRWTIRQIRALANSTGLATTTVLRELEALEDG